LVAKEFCAIKKRKRHADNWTCRYQAARSAFAIDPTTMSLVAGIVVRFLGI
jgi:hypothetical protein